MQVILLGSAAGGGFPQWNCRCPVCAAARETPPRATTRTQSSIAVSADGAHWFLGNASPDVRAQIDRLSVAPSQAMRVSPVEGVVLTDAELDHTLGLALLREGRLVPLWATRAVLDILTESSQLLPVMRAFAEVPATVVAPGAAAPLVRRDGAASGLTVELVPVSGDPPRFAPRGGEGHTSAAIFRDAASGRGVAFVPGCGALDDSLLARLDTLELVLFDGTFFTEREMLSIGLHEPTATQMGHQPVSGAGGSLERLRALAANGRTRVVYTHVNNTNPMLIDASPERLSVERAGIAVGADGMLFSV